MSVPSTFKAAVFHQGTQRSAVEPRSLAALEPGEVAVKVTATAINPVDWKMRDTGMFVKSWPVVLGSDAAGEVAALGPGVSDLAVGDRVFFQGIIGTADSCTFQQYCKMPADLLSRTPNNISDEQAAGISLAVVTAVVGFYDESGRGRPAPWDEGGDGAGRGKAVVVLGGATSVGQFAIQLARISGYERIVTTASLKHRDYLTRLGAHDVLDRHTVKPEDIRAALRGVPLDFVFDGPSSQETQTQGIDVVRATGSRESPVITLIGAQDDVKKHGDAGDIKVPVRKILGKGSDPKLAYLSKPLMRHLSGADGWVAKGLIVPNHTSVTEGGLKALGAALEKVKAGVSGEKVVIRPWEE